MATDTDLVRLTPDSPHYPAGLRSFLAARAPAVITARGNLEILRTLRLAFLCSTRCTGNLILQTYDLARALRDGPLAVISGFHIPMERNAFAFSFAANPPSSSAPPAASTATASPPTGVPRSATGRLLHLSPFAAKHRRPTAELALNRNDFVAALLSFLPSHR